MLISFEEKIDVIDRELKKRKYKWHLYAVPSIDYDDVEQIIRLHLYKQWHKWDQSKPLEPWLNTIISRQMINILRDNYSSYTRPCLQCASNQGNDLCAIYKKQCSDCSLYAKWEKTKKNAFHVKMPISYDNEDNSGITFQLENQKDSFIDYDECSKKIHKKVIEKLPKNEIKVYKLMVVEQRDDSEVASILGYKQSLNASGKNRYKQLEKYKKKFVILARKIIKEEGIGYDGEKPI